MKPSSAAPHNVERLSDVACRLVPWRSGSALRVTLVVKATLSLRNEEQAWPCSPLEITPIEAAPHLPGAGVILFGHAFAPGGNPVDTMSVRLAVAGEKQALDKTLHIFGDRVRSDPRPKPFVQMPLSYARTVGGADVSGERLPNIVDPKSPNRAAGFGALGEDAPHRRALLGALDPTALRAAVPALPEGFDFRYFHAAPPDQQIGFLRGDEWLLLEGMHRTSPRIKTRLPSARACARWTRGDQWRAAGELDLHADGLIIDADRQICSVLWRGHIVLDRAEDLDAMRIRVGLELPNRPIQWPNAPAVAVRDAADETIAGEFSAKDLGALLPFRPGFPASLLAAPEEERPAAPLRDEGDLTMEVHAIPGLIGRALPFTAKEGPREPTTPIGRPPVVIRIDSPAQPLSHPIRVGERDAADGTLEVPPSRGGHSPALPFAAADPNKAPIFQARASRESNDEGSGTIEVRLDPRMLAPPLPFAGADDAARSPAALSADARTPIGGLPARGLAMPERSPVVSTSAAVMSSVDKAAPPSVIAAPEPSTGSTLRELAASPTPPEVLATPSTGLQTPATSASVTREWIIAKVASLASFNDDDLTGADLSGLDLSGRSLERCRLRGAQLSGARLHGAKLAGAVLEDADLQEANLEDADLSGANLRHATLARARLDGATLVGGVLKEADLTGASFAGVHAKGAKFADVRGAGANFRGADLCGADLRRSNFSRASFVGAAMRDAQADHASFESACLSHADLAGASFRRAQLTSAVLAHAILEGADFRNASLERANVHGTVRTTAKLLGANTKGLDESAPADEGAPRPSNIRERNAGR